MKCLFHRCRLFPFLTATGGGRRKKPHFTTTCHPLCEKIPSPPAPITRLLLACARLRPTWFFCCTPAPPRCRRGWGLLPVSFTWGSAFFCIERLCYCHALPKQRSVHMPVVAALSVATLYPDFSALSPAKRGTPFSAILALPPWPGHTHAFIGRADSEPVAGPFQHAQVCRHSARMVSFSSGMFLFGRAPVAMGLGQICQLWSSRLCGGSYELRLATHFCVRGASAVTRFIWLLPSPHKLHVFRARAGVCCRRWAGTLVGPPARRPRTSLAVAYTGGRAAHGAGHTTASEAGLPRYLR